MKKDLAASRDTTWQPAETMPLNTEIDIVVWNVDADSKPCNPFRWAAVVLDRALPQFITADDCPEGYDMAENGQFISHWMYPPSLPRASEANPVTQDDKGGFNG